LRIVGDDRVAKFISDAVGKGFVPPFTCMGIERDGQIIGGALFNVYEQPDIHVTVAGKGWTRGFFAEVGQYVFGTLKCERITAITEQPKVVRIAERLGGQVEGCLRHHFGKGRDGYVIGILKDDYRW
jgi:RimJ/RimL family protein N-acetyltransferase